MIDFKFHVFSLVAIFLALGIGIVIGITLVGDEALVKEQKVIIDRLEEDFKMLRGQSRETQKEVAAFKNSNNTYQKFVQAILPALVKDRLKGQNVVIITTSHYECIDSLINSLYLAGANVISSTKFNTSFNFSDQKARLLIYEKLGIKTTKSSSQLAIDVAEYIAHGILHGLEPKILTFLEEIDIIQFKGGFADSLDSVIILGGSQNKRDNLAKLIDLPIISYFLKAEVKVAGTELSEVPYSVVPLYQTKKIITVDNIDTAIGQAALILALDNMPGHYGIKSTADCILPPLDEVAVGSGF